MKKHEEPLKDRRVFMAKAGAFGMGVAAAASLSGARMALAGTEMAGMTNMHGPMHEKMAEAASHCVKAGNDCIAHCLNLIKEGDTTIIDCLRSAEQMRNFCEAHAYFAAEDSPYLDDMCRLAIKVCGDCKKECDKHAKKHAVCKACSDACANCVEACRKHLKV